MRKKYPSDITKEQFEQIRAILESGRKKTAPRTVDLYEVFCAILYLLKSGCQWRMLPEVFPKRNTVYYYFSMWETVCCGVKALLGEQVEAQVVKRNELHTFEVIPKRWVVEKPLHGWKSGECFGRTANVSIILHCNL